MRRLIDRQVVLAGSDELLVARHLPTVVGVAQTFGSVRGGSDDSGYGLQLLGV